MKTRISMLLASVMLAGLVGFGSDGCMNSEEMRNAMAAGNYHSAIELPLVGVVGIKNSTPAQTPISTTPTPATQSSANTEA